ncbi:UNC5C [Branchiostoma lanceolatum]|uniref:Netrin receptor UNC5 n=1 Tax=Branchiostoma lanceolatum TaxID=7740 RepID=A0A8J9VEB6_BRALA|nr:UNC5C [Branchiostoma lanceolatum]
MFGKASLVVFSLLIFGQVNPQTPNSTANPQLAIPPGLPAIDLLIPILIAVCVVVPVVSLLIVTLVVVCNRKREASPTMVESSVQPAEMTTDEDRHEDLDLFNRLCSDYSNLTGENISMRIQLQTNYSSTNFAAGVFDHTGGHLSLPRHDINLFIPPGAIEDGQLKTIHIFVPPSMNRGKPVPIVHCGPTGTTFADHVILSFPVDPNHDDVVPKFTNTDAGSVEAWQPLLGDDDAAFIVNNGKCTIFLSHFTGFGAEAGDETSASTVNKDDKTIRVGVFASKHTPTDRLYSYQLRIRFYDASADASKHMYHKEMSQFGGRLLDDDKRMQVNRRGGPVRVRVSRIASGWRTTDAGDENQRLEAEELWDDSDETDASCTVRLRKINRAAPVTDVWATVAVWQEQSYGTTVTLKPSDTLQMSLRSEPPRGCLSPTQAFLHQQDELRPSDRALPILPLDVRHEMCVLLDVELPGGNDWRMMAEKFGIDSPTIRWIGRNKSPTSKLLDFWETENVSGETMALQRLCELYEEMERPDVKELAGKVLWSAGGLRDSGYGTDSDSRSPNGSLDSLVNDILSEPFPERYSMNAPLNTMPIVEV